MARKRATKALIHKTNWGLNDTVLPEDFNRIEGNIKENEANQNTANNNHTALAKRVSKTENSILDLEEFKEDTDLKMTETIEKVKINTDELNNRLKLYSRPYYVDSGVIGLIDLGSSLHNGNYILAITLNVNSSGNEDYYTSLLYSLQLVVGWQDNQTINKVYLTPLGHTDVEGIDNIIDHSWCYPVFATTGGNTKPYNQSSSIHIHIPPYTSLDHVDFKNASLYMLDI